MKIFLFKNSKINQKRQVLNLKSEYIDFDSQKEYLKTLDDSFDPEDDSNWLEMNGSSISINSFSLNLENVEDIEKIDYAIVRNFPFLNNKDVYFFVTSYTYNSFKKNWTLFFGIDLLATFSIAKTIDLNKKIKMAQAHLRQDSQFVVDGEYTALKEKAFFRKLQPENSDVELIGKKYPNKIKNTIEVEIAQKLNFDKWLLYVINNDAFDDVPGIKVIESALNDDLTPENTNLALEETFVYLLVPLTGAGKIVKVIVSSDVEDGDNFLFVDIDPQEVFKGFEDDPNLIDIIPIDGSIISGMKVVTNQDGETGIRLPPGAVQLTTVESTLVPYITNFGKLNNDIPYFLKDKKIVWEYEKATDEWEESIDWSDTQEAILNFAPFKYFSISQFNETLKSSFMYSNNETYFIDKQDVIFFIRSYYPTFYSLVFSDFLENKYWDFYGENKNYVFGETAETKQRPLSIPTESNEWKSYNQQKKSRIISDFGNPLTDAGIGAVVAGPAGAGAGAAVGLAIGLKNTILRRKTIKNSPSSISNASFEANKEIIDGMNYKTLVIFEPFEKKKLAYDFFQKGYYLFNQFFYSSEILLSRARFVFFQISDYENTEVLNSHIPKIYKNDYLNLLKSGVTYWNFFPSGFSREKINENIFTY